MAKPTTPADVAARIVTKLTLAEGPKHKLTRSELRYALSNSACKHLDAALAILLAEGLIRIGRYRPRCANGQVGHTIELVSQSEQDVTSAVQVPPRAIL